MVKKVAILMIAAGAYAIGFWPSWWVRDAVLKAFGSPACKGVWILIPHVFLYTTLSALTCLVLWLTLIQLKWLEPIPFAISRSVVIWGLIGGVVSAVAAFGVFAGLQPGAIHAARLNLWVATANLFSNFYEEFVFRGFLLVRIDCGVRLLPGGDSVKCRVRRHACPVPAGIPRDHLDLRPGLVLDREAHREHLVRMDCTYESRLDCRPVHRLPRLLGAESGRSAKT